MSCRAPSGAPRRAFQALIVVALALGLVAADRCSDTEAVPTAAERTFRAWFADRGLPT